MCAHCRAPMARDLGIDFGCILQIGDRFWSVLLHPQEHFVFAYAVQSYKSCRICSL
ncbi:hypothetical protein LguiA_029697 [Lonicera macranthoides]